MKPILRAACFVGMRPLSERAPWLVYVVLIGACAALALILASLAKGSGSGNDSS
jgi:hypothetical protein